eukprot:TRINITY_DN14399_c0_g1_i1.p1 TRINITY_DN14399_c0_g1~~TRINITY_DN14399_c0_g1_i1.p1  ORF type:complete len:458 (-),score=63.98 TRINITY_DN14399_c0_g1_i1:89-1462(-)
MIGKCLFILTALVLSILQICSASVTVLSPAEFYNTTFTPTAHMHYALTSFDVQGELIKAQPIYGCDLEGDPAQYKDKVILVEYDSDYCFAQVSLLSAQALNAKAVIFTSNDPINELITYSWSTVVEEPFTIGGVVMYETMYAKLQDIMATNETVIVRVTSGDPNAYAEMVHRPGWIIFQVLLLAVALSVLGYGLWKLVTYVRFFGPQFSIAQVCLGLQVTGSCATVAAPIVAMSHVFIRSVPDAAYVSVYSFGPAMMTFSTVLVAFYWSGLIFYKKKNQLWNRKLFIGLLVFFLVMLLLYILSGLLFGSATQYILVVIIVIAAACGVYFVVMGGRLIYLLRKAGAKVNVVSSKKRYPRRLVKMLLIAGISIILFVAVSTLVLTPAYDYLDWHAVILGMIQFFCMTTFAAEITLFKNLTAKDHSTSGTVSTSDKTGSAVPMQQSASTKGASAQSSSAV